MSETLKAALVRAFEQVQGYKGLEHERMAEVAIGLVGDPPDLGNLPNYAAGEYSYRNLAAFAEDALR